MDLVALPTRSFDVSQDANSSLGFTLVQRVGNVLDVDMQRYGIRKWKVSEQDPNHLLLNPNYPLTEDEKDVLRMQAMWQLLGSREEVERYFEQQGLVVSRVLTESEIAFLDKNRALYERFRDQPVGLAGIANFPDDAGQSQAEKIGVAKAWLEAHGVVPHADGAKLLQQYHSWITCSIDEEISNLYDRESVTRSVAAYGLPLRTHRENVVELCKNTLHDNPNRPISMSDYQRARFHFKSSDAEELAFARGTGAIRFEFVNPSEVEADLRCMGLPISGSRKDQWRLLHTHQLRRVSRAFLLGWLRRFGFRLFTSQGDQKTEINPESLPKLLLFSLLGQFVSGDVVCTRNPGLAITLTPLTYMLTHFQQNSLPLPAGQQQDAFALFPQYCWHQVQSKGLDVRLTAELQLGIDDRTTRMGLIDALLEEGTYATMRLTPEQRQRVATVLKMQYREGEPFEIELRKILQPYLTDFNGAYLRTWLTVNNEQDTDVLGLENMLAHYTNIMLCRGGWTSAALNPTIPETGSAALQHVLQNAKWLSAGLSEPTGPDVKPTEPDLVQACAAMNLGKGREPVQDPMLTALEGKKKVKRSSRPERINAILYLADNLYMNPPPTMPKMLPWLVKRMENKLKMFDQDPDTGGTDEKRFNDLKLWIESMLPVERLKSMIRERARLAEKIPPNASKGQLLLLLAESNMERYRLIQLWAEHSSKGYLCTKTDEELQRKLDMLDVNTDDMSSETQNFLFMNILQQYLPDDLVSRFLTEADRKQLERDDKPINWKQCYVHYCQRFGSPQMVKYAILYNERLAGRIIVKRTEQSRPVVTPECTASNKTKRKVTEQTQIAMLEVMGNFHLLQRDPDGSINEFLVRSDAQGEGRLSRMQHYDRSQDMTMPSLVAFFEANGETLVRVDDVDLN